MNTFKQLLKASGSHPPVGTWVLSASPVVAEAIGCAGFEWGVIDMEHSSLDMMDVVQLLQAVACTKMVAVVRLPSNDAAMVKRVLDAGATTVLFPLVQTPDEARQAVAATRFPLAGVGGMADMSRAARFGTAPNQLRLPHHPIGVMVQLETLASFTLLEAICDVDGVDAVFIGPAGLAASMGHAGQPMHPKVMELMSQAAQRCKALGKPIGTVGATPEHVAQYRAAGFDYVAVSSDLGLMMQSAQAALAALRTRDTEHVHTLAGGTRSSGY